MAKKATALSGAETKALPGYDASDKRKFVEKLESEVQAELLKKNLVFEGGGDADNQSAFYSISYLLDWGSNSGNDPLDGWAALGLSKLVRKLAGDVQMSVAHEIFLRNHISTKNRELELAFEQRKKGTQ
jgi:hypothetical protein